MDNKRAELIATSFLEQYYPITIFRDVFLEGRVWVVIMDVGLVKDYHIQVRIDASSGKIVGY